MDEDAWIALNVERAMLGPTLLPVQAQGARIFFTLLWTATYSYGDRNREEAKKSGWKKFFS